MAEHHRQFVGVEALAMRVFLRRPHARAKRLGRRIGQGRRQASRDRGIKANASGVPAIVTDQGGPKFIVRHGETGFIAKDLNDFVRYTTELMDDREKLAKLKRNSREFAMSRSWDAVFESVYEAYREAIAIAEEKASKANAAK